MTAINKVWHFFLEVLNKLQTFIACFGMVALALCVVIQVILRYVFNAPLFGIEELQAFFALWLYFFGGCVASYQKSHIQCGIINVFVRNKTACYVLAIVRDVGAVALSIFMTYAIYGYFAYVIKVFKKSMILNIPLVFGEGTIFVGTLIMAIFCVRDAIDTIVAGPQDIRALGDDELDSLKTELGGDE